MIRQTKILKEIGFTDGEVSVYLALIGIGESTIGPIAKRAHVTPAKTYPILEKLKEKGLITTIIKEKTTYFQLLNPTRILNYLDRKQQDIDTQKEQINELIPQLLKVKQEEPSYYASVYEGIKGIEQLYDEIDDCLLKNKEDWICFTSTGEYSDPRMIRFYARRDVVRGEKGISMKILGLHSQREALEKKFVKHKHIEFRFVNQALPTGLIIYGENVATLQWENGPIAFVIHSKENAQVYSEFFYDLWENAKL